MQIQTSSNAFPSFRPIVAPPVRTNAGPLATNVADAAPPVTDADGPSARRERFGDALLRRIDAGDLRRLGDAGREFKFGRRLVQRTRHAVTDALRDGARGVIKDVKKELRSVLRELGDDRATRKEVRQLFKEFRRDVKDVVKSTRSSRQFDTGEIAADLESAFSAFTADLRDVLAPRNEPPTESIPYEPPSVDPGNGASIVPSRPDFDNNNPPPAASAPDPTDAPPVTVESEEDKTGSGGVTIDVTNAPPASVAETRPDPRPRFDGLFGRLDEAFKGGLSDIVDGINKALEDAHEAFDRFRSRQAGGRHGGFGHGRFVDRAA